MILIKGVKVVDGSGKPPFQAEVLLKGDKISAIGTFPNKKADLIIDGLGSYLLPGFIDVNTDSDHYLSLFTNPAQKDFLAQGVTTIIGGQCGASLAPLLYGTLESIRKWTDVNQINVDWHTVGEFFKTLSHYRLGINFGTLIGHSTIRRALIGEDLRNLTAGEMKIFKRILEEGLTEGALGFSTGLSYAHARNTSYEELKELVNLVAKYNGIYTTHLRDEKEGLVAAINETVKLAHETGARTIISHFRPHVGFEKDFEEALAMVNESYGHTEIYFDIYPFDTSFLPIYTLLPLWAQNGGLEIMRSNLAVTTIREKILKELPVFKKDDIVIGQALNAPYLAGKTLGVIAENQGMSLNEALLKVMEITNLQALIFYRNLNMDLIIKSIASPKSLIASNVASMPSNTQTVKHERFINTFPKYLEQTLSKENLLIEKSVQKITSTPAAVFGIKNRGLVKEGYFADLVLWKDNKVQATFVNGQMAYEEGRFMDAYAGTIIKSR